MLPRVGLPVGVADRGAGGIGTAGPLAALQAFEPRFQFGVGVGILAAVARMPEMGRQRQQRRRHAARQRRFLAPRAAAVRMIRVFVFKILVFQISEFQILECPRSLFSRSSVQEYGASPPESTQSLTCLLLQHPGQCSDTYAFRGPISGRAVLSSLRHTVCQGSNSWHQPTCRVDAAYPALA